MELSVHHLRVIERLGILMLIALLIANLGGIFIIGQDHPALLKEFLRGWQLAMIACFAAYVAAQLLLANGPTKISAGWFFVSLVAGTASALFFCMAVLAINEAA